MTGRIIPTTTPITSRSVKSVITVEVGSKWIVKTSLSFMYSHYRFLLTIIHLFLYIAKKQQHGDFT